MRSPATCPRVNRARVLMVDRALSFLMNRSLVFSVHRVMEVKLFALSLPLHVDRCFGCSVWCACTSVPSPLPFFFTICIPLHSLFFCSLSYQSHLLLIVSSCASIYCFPNNTLATGYCCFSLSLSLPPPLLASLVVPFLSFLHLTVNWYMIDASIQPANG